MAKTSLSLLLIIPLLGLSFFAQERISLYQIEEEKNIFYLPEGELIGGVFLGFRELMADLLWVRFKSIWHSEDHSQIVPTLQMVVRLSPYWLLPWKMLGWHLAYNVYAQMEDPLRQQELVKEGINVLKRGLNKNPDRYDLYFEVGWTYYHKAEDYKNAILYFSWANKFSERPRFVERMLAHAYEKGGYYQESLEVWQQHLDSLREEDGSHPTEERICEKFIERLKKRIEE